MTCYHPITACYSKSDYAKTGKKNIHLCLTETPNVKDEKYLCNEKNFPHALYEYIQIPCRTCVGCRSDNAKMWSLRAYNEAKMHKDNCFITLTYDENSLLVGKDPMCLVSLRYKHFQNFMKKLRKEYNNDKIQYIVCGEYGSRNGRAHWHAILFGFDFPDKLLHHTQNGYRHYTSQSLSRLWSSFSRDTLDYIPNGFVDLCDVDYDTCKYVAGYVLKKLDIGDQKPIVGEYKDEYGDYHPIELEDRCPPMVRSSRRPAIGYDYYKKYSEKDLELGFQGFASKGKVHKIKVPEYYFKKYEQEFPDKALIIKKRKEEKMRQYYKDRPVNRPLLETWEQSHLYRIAQRIKQKLTGL